MLICVHLRLSAAVPAQTQPTTSPALWQRMTEIDAKGAAVVDLTADFEQRKFTPLLKKPMVSTGTVKARGAAMLWDTQKPQPTVMLVDETGVSMYYPAEKTVEIYPLEGQLGSLAASPLPRLELLKQHFSFEEQADAQPIAGKLALKLTPLAGVIREHVDRVHVLLDVERGLIDRFELIDVDGERTVITFSNIKTNTSMKDADLQLKLPGNVKTVRPLEKIGAGSGK